MPRATVKDDRWIRAFKIWLILVGWVLLLVWFGAAATHAHPRHHRARVEAPSVWSSGGVVAEARSQIGNGAIYGRRNLWCARFMNYVLAKVGYHGTGSDLAKSFTRFPRTYMHVGAIAVMSRHGGGHVGVVSGITSRGDPVIISGNHGRRVREAVYPRSRIIAFVVPE